MIKLFTFLNNPSKIGKLHVLMRLLLTPNTTVDEDNLLFTLKCLIWNMVLTALLSEYSHACKHAYWCKTTPDSLG